MLIDDNGVHCSLYFAVEFYLLLIIKEIAASIGSTWLIDKRLSRILFFCIIWNVIRFANAPIKVVSICDLNGIFNLMRMILVPACLHSDDVNWLRHNTRPSFGYHVVESNWLDWNELLLIFSAFSMVSTCATHYLVWHYRAAYNQSNGGATMTMSGHVVVSKIPFASQSTRSGTWCFMVTPLILHESYVHMICERVFSTMTRVDSHFANSRQLDLC